MKRILCSPRLLFLLLLLIPNACSRHIPGTPVTNLPFMAAPAGHPSLSPGMKEELARMSRVEENKVFTEKKGYPEYKIGPLDVLEITFRAGSSFKRETVTVRADGTISFSFVDNLPAAELTARDLDEKLTIGMSVFVRDPRVDIIVKEFKSKNAMILGELTSIRYAHHYDKVWSGSYWLKGKTTLLDLLVMAGGYTKDADIKNVKLIRGDKIYYLNLYDIIYRGDIGQNIIIDDGDVVDVPDLPTYGERVYVLGEVYRQGVYPLEDASDLLAALSFAGSYTAVAVEENTVIIRGYERGKKPLVLTADVNAILKKGDLRQNIRLLDGDVVYVPRSTIGDINEFIINTVPLLEYLLYPSDYRDAYWQSDKLRFK